MTGTGERGRGGRGHERPTDFLYDPMLASNPNLDMKRKI
jgi:hypothetical protein